MSESQETCPLCGAPVGADGVPKQRGDEQHMVHVACWEGYVESRQRRLETARKSIVRSFLYQAEHDHLEQRVGGMPMWPHARHDNPEFLRRASVKIARALAKYSFADGLSLVVSGKTGTGKTSLVTATLRRWCAEAEASVRLPASDPDAQLAHFAPRFFFVTGPELVNARRNWRIGHEAPIVDEAKRIPLLIIDELGFEPLSEIPFEVVDHRYRQQSITIVTTGLDPKAFRDRYGDALFRRLTENGALLEDG